MTGIVTNIFAACQSAEERVRLGLVTVFGGSARLLYDVQTLNKEGFEKFTKVVIANLKLLGHHPAFHSHFRSILPILEAQRSLYLSTRFIGSIADLFHKEESSARHVLCLPRIERVRRLDVTKICNTIVNHLETAHFMIKHQIAHFSGIRNTFTRASQLVVGSQEIGQMPGLHFLFHKPKEALIVFSTIWDMGEMAVSQKKETGRKSFFRLAGNVGRLALIALGRLHPHTPQFALLDATLSNMNLISFLYDRSDARKRVKQPIRAYE